MASALRRRRQRSARVAWHEPGAILSPPSKRESAEEAGPAPAGPVAARSVPMRSGATNLRPYDSTPQTLDAITGSTTWKIEPYAAIIGAPRAFRRHALYWLRVWS
jgi:hypothetical protein